MRDILDPAGQWLTAAPLALRAANKRPVAMNDTLTILKDSGAVGIDVLANDFDPEGGALTLVSAAAALGTATVGPGSLVTYAPPPGISGFDTVVYEIADNIGQIRSGQIDVTITEPQLSVGAQVDNTLVVSAETGLIDITVTEPVEFAGTYQADTADLAGGPVNLVAPVISGTVAEGAVLTALAGLWIYDTGAGVPVRSWQWRRAGVDIAGATAADHTVSAADLGAEITVAETLSDGFGQRSATSAGSGAFLPSDDPALLGWWDADDTATITQSGGLVSAWAARAGTGPNLVQASASRQPSSGTRLINGRNVIDFDGSRHLEQSLTLPVSGDVAFHAVIAIDSVASAFAALLAVDAVNDFQLDANNATQFDGRLNATGIGTATALSGGPFSGPLILSVVFDRTGTGSAEIFVGGLSRGTMAYSAPIDPGVMLFVMTNRSENAWINGAVAELVVTGDVTNRASYHAYLGQKWGLA